MPIPNGLNPTEGLEYVDAKLNAVITLLCSLYPEFANFDFEAQLTKELDRATLPSQAKATMATDVYNSIARFKTKK